MDWKEVKTQADADAIMEAFGDFHDGCLKEAHLLTGYWVSPDLSMSGPTDLQNRVRCLIQRQLKAPSAIEMMFEDVTRFNLVMTPENCDLIIDSATLLIQDGTIFWSPNGDWRPNKPGKDEFTWICAKRLHWREVPWMGEEIRYRPKEEDP